MTRIIVDSTCDLPDELMESYGISMLPLTVSIDGKEYFDKVDIKVDEVYESMRKGICPKTSQPNPSNAYSLFQECISKGEDFIFLSFSSKLSGTYQTICSIVEELKEKYNNIKMEVIDTKSGSLATGLIALQASKLVKAGKSFENVIDAVKNMILHIEHVFTITDLSWLIKGGRISKTEGIIGNMLSIKPILHVNDGVMEVIQKVRGKKKALKELLDIVEERMSKFPDQIIGISHADDIDTAKELQAMLQSRMGEAKVIVSKIGSVLGSHLGIGGVGVFFFNDKIESYID
ncbi:DegV family protein [Lutispora thermophila]|uniref:EDD domain protein, DegV family n=1 Tax=Lutispora thermophila DSM 19022 TaxID=1122184 RepID=A0A1M6DKA7_9FIRM|nr:DegV family protein [Lutispora thermophila]SHI73686.1 EDD domain protein, DegV family [Lutispora thermophila DSM 19022]